MRSHLACRLSFLEKIVTRWDLSGKKMVHQNILRIFKNVFTTTEITIKHDDGQTLPRIPFKLKVFSKILKKLK